MSDSSLLSSKMAFVEAQTRLLESALHDPLSEIRSSTAPASMNQTMNQTMSNTMNLDELQTSSIEPPNPKLTAHDPKPPPNQALTHTGVYSDWSSKGKSRLEALKAVRKTLRADARSGFMKVGVLKDPKSTRKREQAWSQQMANKKAMTSTSSSTAYNPNRLTQDPTYFRVTAPLPGDSIPPPSNTMELNPKVKERLPESHQRMEAGMRRMGLESVSSNLNLESEVQDTQSYLSVDTLSTVRFDNKKEAKVPPFWRTEGGKGDTICLSVEVARGGKGIPNELRKLQSTMTALVPPNVTVLYLDYKMQPIYSESVDSDIATFLKTDSRELRKTKKANANIKDNIFAELDDGSARDAQRDDDTVTTRATFNTYLSKQTQQTKQQQSEHTAPEMDKTTLEHFDQPECPTPPVLKIDLSKVPPTTFACVVALTSSPSHPLNDCGIVRVTTYSEQVDATNYTSKHVSGWSPILSQSCLPAISVYRSPTNDFAFQPLLTPRDASHELTEAASLVDSLAGIFAAVVKNGAVPLPHLHVEHCHNCERHNTTTWHVPGSYESHARLVADAVRSRLPPTLITSNASSKKPARCGAFEVTFTQFPQSSLSIPPPPQLLFSKLAGNGFPSPEEVVAAIGGFVLPKRISFPGGEDFAKSLGLGAPHTTQHTDANSYFNNQKPKVHIKVSSGYFGDHATVKKYLPIPGIRCELLYIEARNSLHTNGLVIGDAVGCASGDECVPVPKTKPDHHQGIGLPPNRDRPKSSLKERQRKLRRDAKQIAKYGRDVEGYDAVRTWGRKRVYEFLAAYGITSDGLMVFSQMKITSGAALLSLTMQDLIKISELSKGGDCKRKLDRERLLNGIAALRSSEYRQSNPDPATTTTATTTTSNNNNSSPPNNTLNFSDLPSALAPPAEELLYSGFTPRDSAVNLTIADSGETSENGSVSLSAPLVGSYVVRCTAVGYFPAGTQIISLRQPRTSDSVPIEVSVELHPRLRKVVVALADVEDDDMRIQKGKKISRKGNPKYKGIPIDFIHTETGTKHRATADPYEMCKWALPPGTYALSVDMQVLVVPQPSQKDTNVANYIVKNAKKSVTANSDWRGEVFIRASGAKALMKRKQFIMQAGMRVAHVINTKVARIRARKKHASILLQSIIRVRGVRRRLVVRRNASTKIKAWYKSARILIKWNVMRRGAVFTQAHFRGWVYGRQVADRRRVAARTISKFARVWALRVNMWYFAMANKVQAVWRAFVCRKRYRRLVKDKKGQSAAMLIQASLYRGVKVRHVFHAKKYVAVYLYAIFRGKLLRQSIAKKHLAATKVQTAFRLSVQIDKYKRLLRTVVKVQTFFRLKLAVIRFARMVAIVVSLQTFLRHNYHRKHYSQMRASANLIAATLGPKINRYVKKRELEAGKTLTHIIRRKLLALRKRRYLSSTLLLQRVWRGCLLRKRVGRQHRAASKIQNMVRFDESKAEFKKRYEAVKIIRRFMVSSYRSNKELRIFNAARKIQAILRGALGKRHVWRLVWSALWIQKAFRGYLCRRSFKVYWGTLRLQAAFRGARDRAYLLVLLAAAQTINDWCYKVFVEKKNQEIRLQNAILTIQCFLRVTRARMITDRKRLVVRKATTLQSWFKMVPHMLTYKVVLASVLIIQCIFRVTLSKARTQRLRLERDAATTLQCFFRTVKACVRVAALRKIKHDKSATKIQTCVRRFLWALVWKNYGHKPFDCAVTIAQLLSYFDGAVEIDRPDVEWFVQLSHVKESPDESWVKEEPRRKGKVKGNIARGRTLSFLLKQQDNISLAIHRTTVMNGGPTCTQKVEGKSFELFDCQPSHTLHVFLFWRKSKSKSAFKEDGTGQGLTVDTTSTFAFEGADGSDTLTDFTLAGSGVLPLSRLEARGGRFTVCLEVPTKKRRLSSGSFILKLGNTEAASDFFSGDIRQLVEMGFKASQAAKALTKAGNVSEAATLLLEGGMEEDDDDEEDDEQEVEEQQVSVPPTLPSPTNTQFLPVPTSPAYISLAICPSQYPSSRSLRGLHSSLNLVDAPSFVRLDESDTSRNNWGGDALGRVSKPVQNMCVTWIAGRQAVNVCMEPSSIIQWEFRGGRKTNADGLLEDWAWRVEDGGGLGYTSCTSFISTAEAGKTGLIVCGGVDGSLTAYAGDGLSDEPVFSDKVHSSPIQTTASISSVHIPELSCSVILTAGRTEASPDADVVHATYIDVDDPSLAESGGNTLHEIIRTSSDISCLALGFRLASTCSLFVGRKDGSLEMYTLGLDRELVCVLHGGPVAQHPYGGMKLEEDGGSGEEEGVNGPITALALHRPRGAGDDLVYAAGGKDGKIQLFQGSNLTLLSTVEGHGLGCVVTSLVVDDAGRFLVSGAKSVGGEAVNNGVRIWKTTTLELVGELVSENHSNVTCLCVARGIIWAGYSDVRGGNSDGFVCCWGKDSNDGEWFIGDANLGRYSPTLQRSVKKSREVRNKGWDEDGWLLLDDGEVVEHETKVEEEEEGGEGKKSQSEDESDSESDSSSSGSGSGSDSGSSATEETKRVEEEEEKVEVEEEKVVEEVEVEAGVGGVSMDLEAKFDEVQTLELEEMRATLKAEEIEKERILRDKEEKEEELRVEMEEKEKEKQKLLEKILFLEAEKARDVEEEEKGEKETLLEKERLEEELGEERRKSVLVAEEMAERARAEEEEKRILMEKARAEEEEKRVLLEKILLLEAEKANVVEEARRIMLEKARAEEEEKRILVEKARAEEEEKRILAERARAEEEEKRVLVEKARAEEEEEKQKLLEKILALEAEKEEEKRISEEKEEAEKAKLLGKILVLEAEREEEKLSLEREKEERERVASEKILVLEAEKAAKEEERRLMEEERRLMEEKLRVMELEKLEVAEEKEEKEEKEEEVVVVEEEVEEEVRMVEEEEKKEPETVMISYDDDFADDDEEEEEEEKDEDEVKSVEPIIIPSDAVVLEKEDEDQLQEEVEENEETVEIKEDAEVKEAEPEVEVKVEHEVEPEVVGSDVVEPDVLEPEVEPETEPEIEPEPEPEITKAEPEPEPEPEPETPTIGNADVNRRIRVHWDEGEAYDGVIDIFNPNNGQAHVTYDDGDEEWINPLEPDTSWEFLSPRVVKEVSGRGMRRKSSYDIVSVDQFEYEGTMYFLDHDNMKLYRMDEEQTFAGKLVDGVPDFEAVDSDEEDSD
ncbi:hypothetical protein TrST_g9930 [Triparma strigata]|uniref:UBA domain-containing protein n=1 Tax=Triparma strigata TaxID=1606541 RepID=A0A9W7ABH9_9STRA|nr:hypothetical protein TrST_g9930 [Triparma strigata]